SRMALQQVDAQQLRAQRGFRSLGEWDHGLSCEGNVALAFNASALAHGRTTQHRCSNLRCTFTLLILQSPYQAAIRPRTAAIQYGVPCKMQGVGPSSCKTHG